MFGGYEYPVKYQYLALGAIVDVLASLWEANGEESIPEGGRYPELRSALRADFRVVRDRVRVNVERIQAESLRLAAEIQFAYNVDLPEVRRCLGEAAPYDQAYLIERLLRAKSQLKEPAQGHFVALVRDLFGEEVSRSVDPPRTPP